MSLMCRVLFAPENDLWRGGMKTISASKEPEVALTFRE
jgi:hypothetical protein